MVSMYTSINIGKLIVPGLPLLVSDLERCRNRKKYQVLLNSDKPSQIKCRYIFTSVFFFDPLLCQIRPLAFFYIANIKRPWVHIDCSLLQRTGYFLWFRHLPKALTGRGKPRTINFPILVLLGGNKRNL